MLSCSPNLSRYSVVGTAHIQANVTVTKQVSLLSNESLLPVAKQWNLRCHCNVCLKVGSIHITPVPRHSSRIHLTKTWADFVPTFLNVPTLRLGRILTMVYVVQNSRNFSGLFPSSCIPKKKHDVSETGSVSVLRWRWGEDTYSVEPLRGPNGRLCSDNGLLSHDTPQFCRWMTMFLLSDDIHLHMSTRCHNPEDHNIVRQLVVNKLPRRQTRD
jgi:hypothetical protein